jgi:hypothetical protein
MYRSAFDNLPWWVGALAIAYDVGTVLLPVAAVLGVAAALRRTRPRVAAMATME